MLEERATEVPVELDIADPAGPAFSSDFGKLIMAAQERQLRYRGLVEQLAYALRIAEGPEALDRATIPLALPFGPAKLKELSAHVRLSPYLKANLQALIAIYRAERDELRRLERAAELEAERPGLAVAPAVAAAARALFTWLPASRERFRAYPSFHALLELPTDGEVALRLVPRAMPEDLEDCFFREPAPPEPAKTAPLISSASAPGPSALWPRLRELAARLGGAAKPASTAASAEDDPRAPEACLKLMVVPPLTLCLGKDLIKLIDPALGGDLMERVLPMRASVASQLGFIMPGVQFKDDLALGEQGYEIRVRGGLVAHGEVLPGFQLAIPNPETEVELAGFPALDPTTGRPAVWIPATLGRQAAKAGFRLLEAHDVVVAHLEEVVRGYAYEILSFEETQIMTSKLSERAPTAVKHLLPDRMDFAEFHQVLRALLRERVSIRDLGLIIERLSHLLVYPRVDPHGMTPGMYVSMHLDPSDQFFGRQLERIERAMPRMPAPMDTAGLVEALRQAMAREICAPLADADGQLDIVTLALDLEARLIESLIPGREGKVLALPGPLADKLIAGVRAACLYQDPAIIVCDARLRPALKRFTMRDLPRLHVLAHAEIHPQYRLSPVDTVAFEGSVGS